MNDANSERSITDDGWCPACRRSFWEKNRLTSRHRRLEFVPVRCDRKWSVLQTTMIRFRVIGGTVLASFVLLFGIPPQTCLAEDRLSAIVDRHCAECHNESTTEGEFSLQSFLDGNVQDESWARTLQRIRFRVAAGEMPPEDANTLDANERRQFVALIESELQRLADQFRDDPGAVAISRLTPYEYRNVIRDLSNGVASNAGRFLPNEGGAGEGFANVGTAQVMTLPQYEKYIDAAKDALRHVRVYPRFDNHFPRSDKPAVGSIATDHLWRSYPRPDVDAPAAARKEVVDEMIAWHVAQQQKWGAEHRDALEQELGFVHAAYLEAAWHYANRDDSDEPLDSYCDYPVAIDSTDQSWQGAPDTIALAPAALEKWWDILNNEIKDSPHAAWAIAWRKLAKRSDLDSADVRRHCLAIVSGDDDMVVETEDYAPPYEISYHEAKEEVLKAAEQEGHWPFRIEIGDAEELFLVVTDAGDGNRGEYAVWRRGRFVFRDGSAKPWQEVVTVVGARSGNEFPFGFDGEKSEVLSDDALGAKPPGTLKFAVPKDAIVFEVDLTLDENRTETASIQALVLKSKPKSSSYVPGRFVFGGKKRPATAGAELKKEHQRALRKRNVAEANKTKIGLNAEKNLFANWDRTPIESIGGPWPDQETEQYEPQFPYHYTVPEVLHNATNEDLAELRRLEARLVALVDARDEAALLQCARTFLRPFARRAWRRAITPGELETLLNLYKNGRQQGLSFDGSVKSSMLLVLSSPHFIYKHYPAVASESSSKPSATSSLSSHALANRLAFFLWGSLPDQELLELAERDQLKRLDVLSRQARRMLTDPKARSLARDFAGQLWDFAGFENFNNPDPERFSEFTSELRRAMMEEVEMFLADLFQQDRPITNVLDADYTFANQILAQHYGFDDETHDENFQRVALPAERGGLATMSLFLTKKSLPLRTSPVQRGVWVMENLLGRHLPNPPADVPPLSEDDRNKAGENIRQQLERHRADASCASCHDKIDPLGISLENFDAIGRWRETERDGSALATTAETEDGTKLNGSSGLKRYLRVHQDEFIDHFNRKLLGYALGRSVGIGDQALLERMNDRLQKEHFRFSVLVEEIVSSPQFRTKRRDHE